MSSKRFEPWNDQRPEARRSGASLAGGRTALSAARSSLSQRARPQVSRAPSAGLRAVDVPVAADACVPVHAVVGLPRGEREAADHALAPFEVAVKDVDGHALGRFY